MKTLDQRIRDAVRADKEAEEARRDVVAENVRLTQAWMAQVKNNAIDTLRNSNNPKVEYPYAPN